MFKIFVCDSRGLADDLWEGMVRLTGRLIHAEVDGDIIDSFECKDTVPQYGNNS